MNLLWRYAITLLLYPGALFALVAGWLLLALGRKLTAAWRGTQSPRLTHPIDDFLKLLGKTTSLPAGAASSGVRVLTFAAAIAPLLALVLMPLPGNAAAGTADTTGDLLVVLLLLLLPALTPFFLGTLQASPYARRAAQRTLPRSVGFIALTLLSALAVAAQRGVLDLSILGATQTHPTPASVALDIVTGLIFWFCLPALIPPARWGLFHGDMTFVAGPYTDLTGADLALLQLSAALQRVAAGSFLALVFVLPFAPGNPAAQVIVFLVTLLLSGLWVGLAAGISRRYSFAR
jgi:NADH-quinone oxidoreductase subunit H